MFREIMGLPAHALLVHAAVVFVPLLGLVAIGYAVLPRWRGRTGWAAAALAVVGPVTAFLAKESGEELEKVLTAKNYPPQLLRQVLEHGQYGGQLFWWTLGLGLATGLLLVVTSGRARVRALPSWIGLLLSGAVVVLAVGAMIQVYLTGDSGARAVWQGVL